VAISKLRLTARRPARFGVLLLFAVCGCSRPDITFAPVEGTITRNGKPVPHAQVVFMAEEGTQGPRAIGLTDDSGRFRLTRDDGKEGAPVGRHRVCVIDMTTASEKVSRRGREPAGRPAPVRKATVTPVIPPEYSRPGDTPLRAEVKPGQQTIDFQVP
jgi:hypothetical protein